jgi:hypothetical protein
MHKFEKARHRKCFPVIVMNTYHGVTPSNCDANRSSQARVYVKTQRHKDLLYGICGLRTALVLIEAGYLKHGLGHLKLLKRDVDIYVRNLEEEVARNPNILD